MKTLGLWLLLVTVAGAAEPVEPAAKSAGQSGRKPVLRIAPHRTEALYPVLQKAYQAYLAGEFALAGLLYQQVLEQVPRNLDALLGLAAVAQHRGESAQAMQYYQRVLSIEPDNAMARAGLSAFVGGEESESQLKDLLRLQPDSASLHFALGNHYAREARWSEAQQAYFAAYRLAPQDAEVSFNLAVSLEHLGQVPQAVTFYQRALALDQAVHADFDHAQLAQHIQSLQR